MKGADRERDEQKGLLWLREAAENGHIGAQFQMGVICATGQGVPRDLAAAAEWYQRSAAGGNRFAQHNLATLLIEGEYIQIDAKEARRLFILAAKAGLAEAQIALGDLYASEGDFRLASQWYRKAAEQGSPEGAERLKQHADSG